MGVSDLQTRVAERLDALRLKPQTASLRAGLGRDTVRNILRGRSHSLKHQSLVRLAAVLECDPEFLTGEQDRANIVTTKTRGTNGVIQSRALDVLHEVGAGYWREDTRRAAMGKGLVQESEEFAGFPQWLERVLGEAFAPEYPAGTLVHVVDARAIGFAPRAGDHVILTRYRDDRSQVERSIREVAFEGARRVFIARGPNGSEERLELTADMDAEVAGLILGSYRPRR